MDFEKNNVLRKIEESPEYKEKEREIREEEFQEDVNEILDLQEINKDKGVTVRGRKFIEKALRKKWMAIARDSGQIIACFYKEPLIPEEELEKGKNQIFKIGGSSSLENLDSQKRLLKLLKKEVDVFKENKMKAITKTKKDSRLGKFAERLGLEKFNFNECQKNYPEFLEAYLAKSSKDPEEYKEAEFYVLSGEEKE